MNRAHIIKTPTRLEMADAHASVLRDIDSLVGWVGGECYQAPKFAELKLLREATAEDFKGWPVARMIALAFDVAQPAKVRAAAIDAVAERYLSDDDTQAAVIREANAVALARAEAAEDRRREGRAMLRRAMDNQGAWILGDQSRKSRLTAESGEGGAWLAKGAWTLSSEQMRAVDDAAGIVGEAA